MILGLDHLIYWVQDPGDMARTCSAFEDAGFVLTDRDDAGRDSAPTQQRLICFQDGSYIEILTVRDAAARRAHRLEPLGRQGNGWADYSLLTDDLDGDQTRMRRAGFPVSDTRFHEKKLVDGRPWGVRLINIGIGTGHPALPFVLQDTAGHDLRIPRDNTQHPNGAQGTRGVRLIVRDLAPAVASLSALLGASERAGDPPPGAGEGRRFRVRDQWVDVFAPQADAADLDRHLERRGDSILSVVFSGPGAQALDLDAAGAFAASEIAGPVSH
jgi:hypothetical protein